MRGRGSESLDRMLRAVKADMKALGFFVFVSVSCSLSGSVRSNSIACLSKNVCLHKEENTAPPFWLSSC